MPISAVSDLDIGAQIEREVELFKSDFKNLEDVLQTICGGFFWAALTRDKTWPLQLSEYIFSSILVNPLSWKWQYEYN